jgi:uncharacterized membrane protein
MKKFIQESAILGLIAIPFLYLIYQWEILPQQLPIHFDLKGSPNNWVDKQGFVIFLALLSVGLYILLLAIPKIDPKKSLHLMGTKYDSIRLIIHLFISAFACFLIYAGTNEKENYSAIYFILLGIFYLVLGNYFQTLKPNYFIGIRTPWTIANDEVWKKTHFVSGRIWVIGGLILVLSSFVLTTELLARVFLVVTIFLALMPIIYSYFISKELGAH